MYFDNLTLLGIAATVAVVGLIVRLMFRDDRRHGECHEE
jgi:hypothetical protein